MSEAPDRRLTTRERLAFAFALTVLMVTVVTCSACHYQVSVEGMRSPTQQHNAAVIIRTRCHDDDFEKFFAADNKDLKEIVGAMFNKNGSGVAVSADRVLTAAHVVTCPLGIKPQIMVDPGDGPAVEADVEVDMPNNDIARIRLKKAVLAKNAAPVSIGPAPMIGDRICEASAWPKWNYRCGETQPSPRGTIRVGFMTEFGNSGSGVYVDGKLVGLVSVAWACQSDYPCVGGLATLQGYDWLIP